MSAENPLGRLEALEWLVTTVIADGIARAPLPHDAAKAFQATVVGKAAALVEQGKAQGDTPEACSAASFADALVDLGNTILQAASAASADKSGPRN